MNANNRPLLEFLRPNYWQNKDWIEKMQILLRDRIFSDCVFIVGPNDYSSEIIHGHKLLFVLESPVFEQMIRDSDVEGNINQITITDIHPEDFRTFQQLLYYDDPDIYPTYDLQQIFESYRIADKYQVLSMSENIINYLSSIVSTVSFQDRLNLFAFSVEIKNESLQQTIQEKLYEIDHGSLTKSKINEFSFEAFYAYMVFVQRIIERAKPAPRCHPFINIFSAIESYFKVNKLLTQTGEVDHNEENVNKINKFRRRLLKLINLDNMPINQFITGPAQSKLLSTANKYKLLVHILKKYYETHK